MSLKRIAYLPILSVLISNNIGAAEPAAIIEHPYGSPMKLFLPDELDNKIKKNKDSLSKHGYIEEVDTPPRADYVKERMAERLASANLKGVSHTLENLGFQELDSVNYGALPFKITLLDEIYISENSDKFLLLGGQKLKQMYTDTEFGTLLIDEMINATTTLGSPNIEINGEPATFTYIKYKGQKWATAVYAPVGNRLFIVEADRKLTGRQKDKFLELVTDLSRRSN